jgi:hypothetical protein
MLPRSGGILAVEGPLASLRCPKRRKAFLLEVLFASDPSKNKGSPSGLPFHSVIKLFYCAAGFLCTGALWVGVVAAGFARNRVPFSIVIMNGLGV